MGELKYLICSTVFITSEHNYKKNIRPFHFQIRTV